MTRSLLLVVALASGCAAHQHVAAPSRITAHGVDGHLRDQLECQELADASPFPQVTWDRCIEGKGY